MKNILIPKSEYELWKKLEEQFDRKYDSRFKNSNDVKDEDGICHCHDPMTQTNVLTGKTECYFCGGRR